MKELLLICGCYAIFWLGVHIWFLGELMPVYALIVPLGYAWGHYIGGKKGYIALSSDPYALSLAGAAVLAGLAIHYIAGTPLSSVWQPAVTAFSVAYLGGHAFLFLLVYLYSRFFEKQ